MAVLPVVFYHAGLSGFSGGYVGVDVFFVISGYLITRIIYDEMLEGRFSILHFYERRARRILPALFAVLITTFVVGWFWLSPSDYKAMAQSAGTVLVFLSNIWFWQNSGGYFDGATDYLPLLHTWSLAVEEQFYIFFPILLMLLVRFRAALTVVLIVVAVSLALAIWATPRMQSASFYLLPTRFWEMGMGSLLAIGLTTTNAPRWLREAAGALGLGAIVVAVTTYDSTTLFPGLSALAPVLGAGALIWAGTVGGSLAGQLLSWRPVVFVGLLSYSLYLWHWPIMAFARNRLFQLDLPPAWQVGTILLSLFMAWLSWRFVERPFRAGRGFSLTRNAIFVFSGVGIALLGAMSFGVTTSNGAETRFSQSELDILEGLGRDAQARTCGGARPVEELCVFNESDTQAGSWLFWGDSHAESMLPAILEVATLRGQRLAYANQLACAPLPDADRLEWPFLEREECHRFKTEVEQHILASGAYDTVILHGRWKAYVEDQDFDIDLVAREGTSLAGVAPEGENAVVLEAALTSLVGRLTEGGINVILVGPVPEIPWDVADRMKAVVLYEEQMPSPPSRELVLKNQARTEAVLAKVADVTGVSYVAVAPVVCDTACPTHDGMVAYYRDDHHMTPVGAERLLVPVLDNGLTNSAP